MTPVDDLRAHDPDPLGARQHGGLNEPGDGLGIEDGVVVQKKHEIRFGGDGMGDGVVEATRKSETDVVPQDPALAEGLHEQLVRAVGGGVVDREDADARVRLCREGLEALAEPLGRVSDRKDDEDRGGALGRRGGCRGCTHARFTRAASLAPGDELERKRGPEGPLSAIGAPTLSASSRSSSYGPPSSWRDAASRCSSWQKTSWPSAAWPATSWPQTSWPSAASPCSSSRQSSCALPASGAWSSWRQTSWPSAAWRSTSEPSSSWPR